MTSDGHNNGAESIEHVRVSVLSFTYNHETHAVQISGTPLPICLAQMIAGEGMRMLEEQRRIAAAMQLRQNAEEQARVGAILRKVSGKG